MCAWKKENMMNDQITDIQFRPKANQNCEKDSFPEQRSSPTDELSHPSAGALRVAVDTAATIDHTQDSDYKYGADDLMAYKGNNTTMASDQKKPIQLQPSHEDGSISSAAYATQDDEECSTHVPYMANLSEPHAESQNYLLSHPHQLLNTPGPIGQAPPQPTYAHLGSIDPTVEVNEPPLNITQADPKTDPLVRHSVAGSGIPGGDLAVAAAAATADPRHGDAKESISSTRAIASGLVSAPADTPREPTGRKNSLSQSLKNKTSAFASVLRRLSLKDNNNNNVSTKNDDDRKLSDAEIFKHQMMVQQQMSAHPASVISEERHAGEVARRPSQEHHVKYTGVGKKNARIAGVYSLTPAEETRGGRFSGHFEQRRGSIQKIVGKITKNEAMREKGEQAEISGKEKVNAYKTTKQVTALI